MFYYVLIQQVSEDCMSGTLWIISYVVLCFTVICLSLALGALYRMLGKPSAKDLPTLIWPLPKVMPGQKLDIMFEPLSSTVALKLPLTGFCLFVTEAQDMFSTITSAVIVADTWKYPLLIVTRDSEESEWFAHLPHNMQERVAHMSIADFQELEIKYVPTLVFLRDGRVVDAVAGLQSPSTVKDFFQLVAEPSLYQKGVVQPA